MNATNTPGDATSTFRIIQPGSYYLNGNLTGEAGKRGITIAADGVTLDLMGFDLVGVPTSTVGILVAGGAVSVRNGSFRLWGSDGINFHSNVSDNGSLIDLRALDNGGAGITAGNACVIHRCTSALNTSHGFSAFNSAAVSECTAYQNGGRGFALVTEAVVNHCTAEKNNLDGFRLTSGIVSHCTASDNLGNGFDGNVGSHFVDCYAAGNSGDGIHAGAGSSISYCSARANVGDGIQLPNDGTVRASICENSESAGIHVVGTHNRIEGNTCTHNLRGIDVGSAGNLINRNSCASNTTDYVIVANNRYGPILDLSAVGTAAVNGSAAPGTLTSSDSNANYSY